MFRNELVLGTKTDIWRMDAIGEGDFRHSVGLIAFVSSGVMADFVLGIG